MLSGGWRFEAWPGGDDKFVKFVLLKENMDTQVQPAHARAQLLLFPRQALTPHRLDV